jgi:pimeloyl-ACP methyl ester carboxylesterase
MISGRTRASLAAAAFLAACAPAATGDDAVSPPSRDASAYPPTGRFVQAGGTRVHVYEAAAGRTDAPTVILIHGASGNSRDFSFDLTDRLDETYRVLAMDRPGLGHTPPLHGRGESPFEQAALLDAAAEELGVERALVVGHSYGGAVAMAWALEHPGRVAGVVSLAGATMPWPGGLGPWYTIASSGIGGATVVPLVSALAPPAVARNAIESVFAPQKPPDGYAQYIGIGLSLRPETLRSSARQVNVLKPYITAMAERYHQLEVPVEVVHGTADTIVPMKIHGARMVELIPDARLTPLEGVGHMPHHARPEVAVSAIDRVAGRAGLR